MSNRVVVRSDLDFHIFFSIYEAHYPNAVSGIQPFIDHRHNEIEVSVILSGTGLYNCNGEDCPFSPGTVFLHSANASHYFSYINPGEKHSLLALRFDSRFVWSPGDQWFDTRYLQTFLFSESLQHCIPPKEAVAGVISRLLSDIFQECHNHLPAYELVIRAKIMSILANITRYFSDKIEPQPDNAVLREEQLRQMESSMSYIRNHLQDDLSLNLLDKEAAMSRSYYAYLFKLLNHVSVWEYITNQRMDLAQYYLLNTKDSIMNISGKCGYNSLSNFNRTFKRFTGKTPRQYRTTTEKPYELKQ